MGASSISPLAVPILDACQALGIGRSLLYEMLDRGELRAIRLGSRRLVPVTELQRIVDERMKQEATHGR